MLEIRYGKKASRSHENIFFRKFARSLKGYFDAHDINGVLLGYPTCRIANELQIDALLITERTMIIIDFKNYSGTLTLPDKSNFKVGDWEMSSGVTVRGGSKTNPFLQLEHQRRLLAGMLKKKASDLTKFKPNHISTVVCFTKPVEVIGSIPGKLTLRFFITDSRSYLEMLFDIVSVEDGSSDLLNDGFLEFLNSTLFESRLYDCYIPPENFEEATPKEIAVDIGGSSNVYEPDIWDQVTGFMKGNDDVLIITGTAGSGKRSLAGRLRECAYSAGFTSARLFALSNRVRNNLMDSVEDVESLYAAIYDFSKEDIDEQSGKEVIPLAAYSPTEAFEDLEPQENTEESRSIFIVYESQMVTNAQWDKGAVRFGSGELLNDILDYLSIPKSKANKVVFIGDKFQLGFGSWGESSLNPAAYQKNVSVATIELPDNKNPDGIERVCLEIADQIRTESYSELTITPNEMIEFKPKQSKKALVEEVANNWTTHKIIAYSNKRSYDLNSYIKQNVIENGKQLAPRDLVIFNNQVSTYQTGTSIAGQALASDTSEPVRIENGEFGIVQRIGGQTLSWSHSFENLTEPVSLNLVQAEIQLESGISVTVEVLEEYLHSEKAALSPYEERAMQILLKELLASTEKKHPFAPGDPDFDEMIEANDYIKTEGGRYRDKNDARRLTIYEKRHREKLTQWLASDPNSEFYRWKNAARIKFGWCITVHKAMSYKWPHVVFETTYDQGRSGREGRNYRECEYFKFIYTGISRASEEVSLLAWKNPSPFFETEFIKEAVSPSKEERTVVAKVGEGSSPASIVKELVEKVLNKGTEISSVESKNYLEIVRIEHGESQLAIGFDYNGEGEIRSPRLLKGDPQFFESLVARIAPSKVEANASPLGHLYERLNRDVLGGITLSLIKPHQYQDRISLEEDGARAEARVIYKKRGTVTRFELISGSESLFSKTVDAITSYCDWETENGGVDL